MAKIIPNIPKINKLLTNVPNSNVEFGVKLGSKAMRAKIELWDRRFRGFERIDVDGSIDSYEYETSSGAFPGNKAHREIIAPGDIERTSGITVEPGAENYTPRSEAYKNRGNRVKEMITILDIDYNPTTSQKTNTTETTNDAKPTLSNRRYDKLSIPFVPRELQVNPESNFVGISSFGRNNPFYQFTGAEDTLTFEIDWISTDNSREDVITYCRWIEALTKGDDYNDTPHRVILVWGNDNKLFKDHKWLVTAAPYKLMNFNRGYMKGDEYINTHMLPSRAIQNVTLKRITDTNLSSASIIGNLNVK